METKFEKFFKAVKGYAQNHSSEETYIFAMGYGEAMVENGIITLDEYDEIFGEVIKSAH